MEGRGFPLSSQDNWIGDVSPLRNLTTSSFSSCSNRGSAKRKREEERREREREKREEREKESMQ